MPKALEQLIDAGPRVTGGQGPSIPSYVRCGRHQVNLPLMWAINAMLSDELAARSQVKQIKLKFGVRRIDTTLGAERHPTGNQSPFPMQAQDLVRCGGLLLPEEEE